MKTKFYTIIILLGIWWMSPAHAENLLKSEQEKMIEKIITEIFVSGNQHDFLTASRGGAQASYIDGYGLVVQTPTYHISSSYFFSQNENVVYRLRENSNASNLNMDSLEDLRNEMVKDLMQKFIVDYGNLAREVKENEKIYLYYNQQKSGAANVLANSVWPKIEENNKNLIISAEVAKADIAQYKSGKIDKQELLNRLSMSEKTDEAINKLEYKVLSTVFESAVEEQMKSNQFRNKGNVSYQVMDGFGVIYYVKINTPFMFNFMPRVEMMIPEISADGNKIVIRNRKNDKQTIMVYDKVMENIRGLDGNEGNFNREPRGILGVQIANLEDFEMRKKIPGEKGVLVVRVNENSPAEKAGIKNRDVIVQIDKEDIGNVDGLVSKLRQYEPGDEVKVAFYREGKMKTVPVKLQDITVDFEQEQMKAEEIQKAAEMAQRSVEQNQEAIGHAQKAIERAQESLQKSQMAMRQEYNGDEQRKEEMQEAMAELLEKLREYMVEYGITLPDMDKDDVLMVEVSLLDCHYCKMPKSTTLMVKNDVLQKYESRQMSKEDAIAQVSIASED